MRVEFFRENYRYRVFSRLRRDDVLSDGQREPVFEDGLAVFRDEVRLSEKVCDDSGEGFRVDLTKFHLPPPY